MIKRITDGWTPKYYLYERVITADDVARFYGACIAKMFMGNRSMDQIFCSREFFDAVPPIQEAMPNNALEDLTVCLHYSDDWECTDNWDDIYDGPGPVLGGNEHDQITARAIPCVKENS
jgi:hypothetical protein